ncbi:hypothetical protein [uncultured Legionella sp.]|uniref:hypothetical protein n=1 Tax=uncultured Legionella sp. TaxID=210934 RepID=UPI0026204CEE|nr:hypothetical protein [uncultured Legionella sp.]
MNIYIYVNGQLLFTVNSDVKHEYVRNRSDNRDYIGIRGSEEILSVYKDIERKFLEKGYESLNTDEDIVLTESNINEYLAAKLPNIERLELRADNNSLSSTVSNTIGKQYGYPLVWLNCSQSNNPKDHHQWERLLFQPQDGVDKIGTLIDYFEAQKKENESNLYKGKLSTFIDQLKNSASDNLLLKDRRISTNVDYEVTQLANYDKNKQFAFYENDTQITYITNDVNASLQDIFEKKLFDKQVVQYFDDDGVVGGTSKTIKILSPVTVRNLSYSHVTMEAVTLTMVNGKIVGDVTLHEGLLSDPFHKQEQQHVSNTQRLVTNFMTQNDLEIKRLPTAVNNMKLQLPLQTHCGRFVMTWMAAEVADIDITRLSNYSEPFGIIFNKNQKYGDMSFPSDNIKVPHDKALQHFSNDLKGFLDVRQKEFAKQYSNKGKNEIGLAIDLFTLVDRLKKAQEPGDLQNIIHNLSNLSDPRLKKIINDGMANLGYGSLETFLTKAQNNALNLEQKLTTKEEKISEEELDNMDGFHLINKPPQEKGLLIDSNASSDEDDFFEIEDINEEQLAGDKRVTGVAPPSKSNEIKDKLLKLKKDEQEVEPRVAIKIK